MSKGILLASGCSYTDSKFKSRDPSVGDRNYPMWPEHVGKELSLEVINSGRSGYDNLTIHNNVIRDILKYGDRVKGVCILWSGFDRIKFMHITSLQLIHQLQRACAVEEMGKLKDPRHLVTDTGLGEWLEKLARSDYWNAQSTIMGAIADSITYMASIAEICEMKGIPYIFYQGVFPISWTRMNIVQKAVGKPLVNDSEILKRLLSDYQVFQLLEKHKKNIIGYPIFKPLGGECFDNLRENKEMTVSEDDFHPNGEGQEKLAEIFLEKYYKVYGRP